MVLERIFSSAWLEKHFLSSFTIGVIYSALSLVLAQAIFPQNTGIVSLVFLSLLLTPSLRALLREEEANEEKEKRLSIKHLYNDNKQAVKTYTGIFLGVFSAYFATTAFLPFLGLHPLTLVQEQLFIDPALAGRAAFDTALFTSILANNWLVLVVTFLLAVLIAEGSIFFVVWNASAWGAVFGYRALTASLQLQEPLLVIAATLVGLIALHVLLEGGAYILAAISGSVISTSVMQHSKEINRFSTYAAVAATLYVLFSKLATNLQPSAHLLLLIPLFIAAVYLLRYSFEEQAHQEVFAYNFWLFIVAVAALILGTIVETILLSTSTNLHTIYSASTLFSIN